MCLSLFLSLKRSLSSPIYVPTSATPLDTEISSFLAVFPVLSLSLSDVEMAHASPTETLEDKSFTLCVSYLCQCQNEVTQSVLILGPRSERAVRSPIRILPLGEEITNDLAIIKV